MLQGDFAAFIVLAFALTACGGGGNSASEESFVSGDGSTTFIKISDRKIAPAITGMTLSGENYTYQKDRVAVVNVWASWCSPCRAEIPALNSLSEKNLDVQFVMDHISKPYISKEENSKINICTVLQKMFFLCSILINFWSFMVYRPLIL